MIGIKKVIFLVLAVAFLVAYSGQHGSTIHPKNDRKQSNENQTGGTFLKALSDAIVVSPAVLFADKWLFSGCSNFSKQPVNVVSFKNPVTSVTKTLKVILQFIAPSRAP